MRPNSFIRAGTEAGFNPPSSILNEVTHVTAFIGLADGDELFYILSDDFL